MEISIKGDPKEIAALVLAVQERQDAVSLIKSFVERGCGQCWRCREVGIDNSCASGFGISDHYGGAG